MVRNDVVDFLIALCTMFCMNSALAQTVSNAVAEQQDKILLIHYTLQTDSPCELSLQVSMNNGRSWAGPLLKVTGDIGKNISSGSHAIQWQVLEEQEQLVGDQIQFKVVASGKKSVEPEMVFVQGGSFNMGSSDGEDYEKPVHQVTLSDFSLGKYEVTQAQWQAVMGSNPSNFSGCDQCPVETVSWDDVQDFISKLNQQAGKSYRLPTEAEWEYAAKGGNKSRAYTYSGSNDLDSVAWYYDNSSDKTHPVGQKLPNELDLYDMSGNVWEWCSDWYENYSSGAIVNPKGASSGQSRVLRGGSWISIAQYCRPSNRSGNLPDGRFYFLGFRLVLAPVR